MTSITLTKQKVSRLNILFGIEPTTTVLCQMIVTRIPDKVARDKFILLDTKLDIRDEILYFIDDLVTSYYKLD